MDDVARVAKGAFTTGQSPSKHWILRSNRSSARETKQEFLHPTAQGLSPVSCHFCLPTANTRRDLLWDRTGIGADLGVSGLAEGALGGRLRMSASLAKNAETVPGHSTSKRAPTRLWMNATRSRGDCPRVLVLCLTDHLDYCCSRRESIFLIYYSFESRFQLF